MTTDKTSSDSKLSNVLVADLSRLCFAIYRQSAKLDYKGLVQRLAGESGKFDLLLGFAMYTEAMGDPGIPFEQLRGNGWKIPVLTPRQSVTIIGTSSGCKEATIISPEDNVRFDTQIAFALGRLAGEASKVVVISDSFALAGPILQSIDRGTKVELAFFTEELDRRWLDLKNINGLTFRNLNALNREHIGLLADQASTRKIPGLP